jgi:hypothetical protein
MTHTTLLETLRLAESAMFHVLSDRGFNSQADKDAMREALTAVRSAMLAVKEAA